MKMLKQITLLILLFGNLIFQNSCASILWITGTGEERDNLRNGGTFRDGRHLKHNELKQENKPYELIGKRDQLYLAVYLKYEPIFEIELKRKMTYTAHNPSANLVASTATYLGVLGLLGGAGMASPKAQELAPVFITLLLIGGISVADYFIYTALPNQKNYTEPAGIETEKGSAITLANARLKINLAGLKNTLETNTDDNGILLIPLDKISSYFKEDAPLQISLNSSDKKEMILSLSKEEIASIRTILVKTPQNEQKEKEYYLSAVGKLPVTSEENINIELLPTLTLSTNNSEHLLRLALAKYQIKDYEQAKSLLEMGMKFFDTDLRINELLIALYLKTMNFKTLLELTDKLSEYNNVDKNVLNQLKEICKKELKYQDLFDKSLNLANDQNYDDAILQAYKIPEDSRFYTVVREKIDEWNNIKEKYQKTYKEALALASQNRYEEAIKHIQDIPKGIILYTTAQKSLVEWHAKAKEQAEKLLYNEALALASQNRYEEAIESIKHIPKGSKLYSIVKIKINEWIIIEKKRAGKILFSGATGNGRTQIYSIEPDGSKQTQLNCITICRHPHWTPDGKKYAFLQSTNNSYHNLLKGGIYTLNKNGGNLQLILDSTPKLFALSPNSQEIAMISHSNFSDGGLFIWNLNTLSKRKIKYTTLRGYTSSPGTTTSNISWSPDGKQFTYGAWSWDSSGNVKESFIYLMNIDGSNHRKLTSGTYPTFSPDGTKIAFTKNGAIYLYNFAISSVSQLTQIGSKSGNDFAPVWSPNGRKIAFISTRNNNSEIYIVNTDGSNEKRLTYNNIIENELSWSPR